MPDPRARRSSSRSIVVVALVAALATVVGCAKVEESGTGRSTEGHVTYVAARLIPAGKTVRAAVADGSISQTRVPADVVGADELDNPGSVECLVAGQAIPSGSLLARSMFVDPQSLGLDRGLTDGTTVDSKC